MASSYSPKLRFELIAPGEQAGLWGDTTNENIGTLIEQAIAGVANIDLAAKSGDLVLEAKEGAEDQARSAVLSCFGTAAGDVNLVIPSSTKLYVVRNSSSRDVYVKTASQLLGTKIASGEANLVYCDGANALAGIVIAGASITPVGSGGTGVGSPGFTAGYLKSPGGTTAFATVSGIPVADIVGQLTIGQGGTGIPTAPVAGQLLIGTSGGGYALGSITGSGGITVSNTSGAINISSASGSAVTSVFGRPGPAITALSTDYSSFYYPLTGNPSNFVTSSALSGYAALASGPTFTGGVTANGFLANGASSIGDQKISVPFGGFSSGMSSTSLQIGIPQSGLVYDNSNGGLSMGLLSGINISCFPAFLYTNTDNTQRPTGGPWVSPSDERLKENIQDYTKGLSALNFLRPVNYTLKGKLGEDTKHKICTGLIAQEVLDTPLASMVGTNPDGFYSLDANEVTWALVNAVKELKAELDSAKAEIAALKAK